VIEVGGLVDVSVGCRPQLYIYLDHILRCPIAPTVLIEITYRIAHVQADFTKSGACIRVASSHLSAWRQMAVKQLVKSLHYKV
jgi:hypothetical protein